MIQPKFILLYIPLLFLFSCATQEQKESQTAINKDSCMTKICMNDSGQVKLRGKRVAEKNY